MNIRKAEGSDREVLAKELWLPLAEMMEKYNDVNQLKDDAGERAVNGFKRLLESEEHQIFVLEDDKARIGYITVKLGESSSMKKDCYIDIVDLFVKEGFRRKGYGRELIERAREYAEGKGCDYITVSAEWGNYEARKFYEKNDFVEKQVKYVKELE